MVQAKAQAQRPEAEFNLVMRIDKPQPAVQDAASFRLAYPFEGLGRHFAPAYVQKFVYLSLRFLEHSFQLDTFPFNGLGRLAKIRIPRRNLYYLQPKPQKPLAMVKVLEDFAAIQGL